MLRLHVLAYGKDAVVEEEAVPLTRAKELVDDPRYPNVWMNVAQGLAEEDAMELERVFGIHPLALEDVRKGGERPKLEDYENHHYVVLHALKLRRRADEAADEGDATELELLNDQMNLFFAKNWVLTIHRGQQNELETVRKRIREGRPRIRAWGPDYLATMIIDAIVDGYFPVIEQLRDEAEDLEDEVILDPRREVLERVHTLRRVVVELRRRLWPARDMVAGLSKLEGAGFQKRTQPFLRDIYDHIIVVVELSEGLREASQAILEVYLSSLSNRTNEIMKVLTIMATIFIPLTFIVGIYGMNFAYMPELAQRWGYPAVWVVMLLVAGSLVVYFRRRGWL